MTDELTPDPFERQYLGTLGLFVHRTNPDHVEHCRKAIRLAWAERSTAEVVPAKSEPVKLRRAA